MNDSTIATLERQASQQAQIEPLKERVNEAIERQEDVSICAFTDALKSSVISGVDAPDIPDVGEWQPLAVKLLLTAKQCNGKIKSFENALKTLSRKESGFARLYLTYQAAREPSSPDTHVRPATTRTSAPDCTMPDLDACYLPAPGLSAGVGTFLEEFKAFCRATAGRGYEGHFEVAAAWLLSTVASARVCFHDGSLQWTPLNAVIVAPSSSWGKTATAQAANRVIREASLHWLLSSNASSPEKLLSNMAGKYLPSNYGTLSEDLQELERARLAHSGQRGWYYSELGQLIREIANDRGRNAPFKGFILRMDDCEMEFENDTFKRERETIERPCLSLLGTMVPRDLIARQGDSNEESWASGFFGRFMFSCPAPGILKTREQLEREDKTGKYVEVPCSLVRALVEWNRRLGMRECELEPVLDKKGEATGEYAIEKGPFPATVYALAPGAQQMLKDYGIQLTLVAQTPDLELLENSYVRLRDKALRIAALVASLEDREERRIIEPRHMAYGIEFAERRRQELHNLLAYLAYSPAKNDALILEKEILDTLARDTVRGLTTREMRQNSRLLKQAESEKKLDSALKTLCDAGAIVSRPNGRRKEYCLCDESEA